MPKVEIPRDILYEMQQDGLIPGVVLGPDHVRSQAVDVCPAMKQWCMNRAARIRKRYGTHHAAANSLDIIAQAIEFALVSTR
jgi:hypothetical protein